MIQRLPEPIRAPILRRPVLAAIVGVAAVVLVLALIIFLLTRGGNTVNAGDASITLTEILNQVETDKGDAQFAVASVGQVLATGDGVRTFPDSQARVDLAVRDFKRVVRTTPNTVWRLGQFGVDKDTIIEMDSGKVFMWDSGEADGSAGVKVVTPAGVAAVRGTWMSVNFDAVAGLLELDCYRGSCELTNDKGTTLLTDKQKSQTTATTTPTQAVPMEQDELDEWKQLPEVLRGSLIIPEVEESDSTLPDFDNAASFDTVQDFAEVFNSLAYEWSDNGNMTGSYRMERLGEETVSGAQTTHLKATFGDSGGTDSVIETWTDAEGTVRKMVMDGEEIPEEQLPAYAGYGTLGFFAPLASVPDIETFDESMFSDSGFYDVVSSRTESRTFGDERAETYILEVGITGQGSFTWEISDFGNVTLFTAMRFKDPTSEGVSAFEVTEVSFR